MTLKDRILKLLDKKGFSYSELCEEINISEKDLDKFIEIEHIKALEDISKILGIPLYSFYNNPSGIKKTPPPDRHYDQDIWED